MSEVDTPKRLRPRRAPYSDVICRTVQDAMQLTGLSQAFLYARMKDGDLAYFKVGRRRLISAQSLTALLEGRTEPAA
jgi:excisionase family DNA binding protein